VCSGGAYLRLGVSGDGVMRSFFIVSAYGLGILALLILGVAGMLPALWLAATKTLVEWIERFLEWATVDK
jgi:hypothetical protein